MKSKVIAIAVLFFLAAFSAAAQETVPVYDCIFGSGCAETTASGKLSTADAEFLIGKAQPSPDHYIACESLVCAWTAESIADLDATFGGDGTPWKQGDEIDLGPFDPEVEIDPESGSAPIIVDPESNTPYVVTCNGDICTVGLSALTVEEAELLLGERPTDTSYILCTAAGCSWWSGDFPLFEFAWQPRDGAWNVTVQPPATRDCTVNIPQAQLKAMMDQMLGERLPTTTTAGNLDLDFSNPPQASDFSDLGSEFAYSSPALNTYQATLDVSNSVTTGTATFTWLVESPVFVTASVVVEVRNSAIGCTILLDATYEYAG